eukprot:7384957-Prymnesium_polylepis.1
MLVTELQSAAARPSMVARPAGVSLDATTDSIETVLSASVTERVPSADDLRPVNGKVSGLRWHCALTLTRPTESASASMSGAHLLASPQKTAACEQGDARGARERGAARRVRGTCSPAARRGDARPCDAAASGPAAARARGDGDASWASRARLLPKSGLGQVLVALVESGEGGDRDERAELLLLPDAHALGARVEHGRADERAVGLLAEAVDHLGALGLGILDELDQVRRLVGLGQRRQLHARLPRQSELHRVNGLGEELVELVDHLLVHEEQLERGAALACARGGGTRARGGRRHKGKGSDAAREMGRERRRPRSGGSESGPGEAWTAAARTVVGERPGDALLDGGGDVNVIHDDAQVLRVEREARLEAVRLRVDLEQRVCRLRAADERKNVDLPARHDGRHRRAAGARDE